MFTFNSSDIVGTIKGYNGATPPSGWLFCDGSAVSRTTYADLFAVIGTNYGAGDGTTTFNLPNWKSVVSAVTIPSTIAVYGNGKTLGVTNGSHTAAPSVGGSAGDAGFAYNGYNKAPTNSNPGGSFITNSTIGVVQNTDGTSGLIAKSNSITRSAFNSKFIIKFQ